MRHVSQDGRCAGTDPNRSRQHQPANFSSHTAASARHIKRGLTAALPTGKPSLFWAHCHTF